MNSESGVNENRLRVVEWVKTALIAALTASALFLGWRTGLLNEFFRDIPFFGSVAGFVQGSAGAETADASVKEAARPLTILITDADGERFGVRYDVDARNAVYDRTSNILAEALGSMSDLSGISEYQWRAALDGAGVYFEYASPVMLSVLGGWLGVQVPDISDIEINVTLRRIFTAFGEDRNRIYFQDDESGLFFGAETASSAGRAQELGIYSPNGALFAFETGVEIAENAPYLPIMLDNIHPVVGSGPAGSARELLDMAIIAFGHRGELNMTDYNTQNTLICTGADFDIRVYTDGRVTYRRTDGFPPMDAGRKPDEGEMIEQARVIVADTIDITAGAAEVFFQNIEYDFSGNHHIVTFGYYIAGGHVHLLGGGYAGKVTFFEGIITEAELNFRSLLISDEYSRLLPEIQAIAAAGGEFMLSYSEAGPELLQPEWVRTT